MQVSPGKSVMALDENNNINTETTAKDQLKRRASKSADSRCRLLGRRSRSDQRQQEQKAYIKLVQRHL